MQSIVGQGNYSYTPQVNWEQLPADCELSEVVAVDMSSDGRVFVFTRGTHPVYVFNEDGSYITSWGDGVFQRPHGLVVAPDDTIYCADDFGHAVYRFSLEGERLATMGTPGQPSNTGVSNFDYRTMKQPAGPFNAPTNVAIAPDGSVYVADGYCNARVHRYSADLELQQTWGEPGDGPGQFSVVHDVGVAADGTVFICDRENSRLQLFSPNGDFIEEWTDVARPCNVVFDEDGSVFVTEMGFHIGMYVGNAYPSREAVPARLSIFDRSGALLSRWGSGDYGQPGQFFATHGICLGTNGDLYVGEVRPGHYGTHASDEALKAPSSAPVLQKFVRT